MSFTQPCFIRKNTPELRKKLEELGYKAQCNGNNEWFIPMNKLPYLVTYPCCGSYMGTTGYWYDTDIDCEENEELFLALAALRDDSDYMQWFVSQAEKDSPKVFIKSTTHSCAESLAYTHRWDWRCSKATVEEIIEHFKDK